MRRTVRSLTRGFCGCSAAGSATIVAGCRAAVRGTWTRRNCHAHRQSRAHRPGNRRIRRRRDPAPPWRGLPQSRRRRHRACALRRPHTQRFTDLGLPAEQCSADWHDVIADASLDIVIELIGGTGVAREVVLAALNAGKSVVTANKALLASHGEEVMQAAEANGVDVLFEASVGGGIPIIAPAQALPDQQRDPDGHGNRERHHQLHAHAHGRLTASTTTPLWPRRRPRASPRPTRPPTSMVWTPPPRSRSCAPSHSTAAWS